MSMFCWTCMIITSSTWIGLQVSIAYPLPSKWRHKLKGTYPSTPSILTVVVCVTQFHALMGNMMHPKERDSRIKNYSVSKDCSYLLDMAETFHDIQTSICSQASDQIGPALNDQSTDLTMSARHTQSSQEQKTFTYTHGVRTHTHTQTKYKRRKKKAFVCGECSKGYSRQYHLTAHLKSEHDMEHSKHKTF